MTNDMILKESTTPAISSGKLSENVDQIQNHHVYEEARIVKLNDEIVAAEKSDRINTKRALAADITSKERVQNQNDRVISACEKELKRKDLTDAQRCFYLEKMSKAAESTAYESAESREFQEKQLAYSHKQPWRIITGAALIVLLFAGCGVLKRMETK